MTCKLLLCSSCGHGDGVIAGLILGFCTCQKGHCHLEVLVCPAGSCLSAVSCCAVFGFCGL